MWRIGGERNPAATLGRWGYYQRWGISTLALIRPGLRPAHPPPQGKAIGGPCGAYCRNYRIKNPNVAKHVGFPSGGSCHRR